ncbi:MAG: hypothetical protein ACI4D7_01230 [Lachnospiraceae bacterium]
MADIAASVLARLKTKAKKVEEAISFACSFFARRSFYAAWRNPSMLKILF